MPMRLCQFVPACLLATLGLAACAGAPRAPEPELFHDAWFRAPRELPDTGRIFAFSDGMRRYFDERLAHDRHSSRALTRLVDELTGRGGLKLLYDSSRTRTAAEAFDARQGNCLSLVIMTAAFAKELGLLVEYRSADVEDIWGRSGHLLVGSGHIDITLAPAPLYADVHVEQRPVNVDFLPPEQLSGMPTHSVSEATVVAMFMNNRAVEALAEDRVDDAYAWTRAALRQDPELSMAYNTLGVVYRHHGDLPQSATALRRALEREPGNRLALSNLADTLEQLGDTAQSAQLRARLAALEPEPPFHFYDLGMIALRRHDYPEARELFAREVARAGYYHEFHFWLAVADYRLGRLEEAGKELRLARANSTTRRDRDLYAAKLAWLRGIDAGEAPGAEAH